MSGQCINTSGDIKDAEITAAHSHACATSPSPNRFEKVRNDVKLNPVRFSGC
ncbi:hypothetical protein PILCRDRAFT_822328 [Piloderma croceum F 1598]|uniref:Uncharacterized protein n=1 Tax=Piloderma croceum (strain F 1598) TaxID=765440 RepID=A0A0C3FN13_PILCF|nr:hypothetical protein PILCRDRAFT_822328 [Piloderma croceum F 1598]